MLSHFVAVQAAPTFVGVVAKRAVILGRLLQFMFRECLVFQQEPVDIYLIYCIAWDVLIQFQCIIQLSSIFLNCKCVDPVLDKPKILDENLDMRSETGSLMRIWIQAFC